MIFVIVDVGDVWWDLGIYFEVNSFCFFFGSYGIIECLIIIEDCVFQELEVGFSFFLEEEYLLIYIIIGGVIVGVGLVGILFIGFIDEIVDIWFLLIDIMMDSLV